MTTHDADTEEGSPNESPICSALVLMSALPSDQHGVTGLNAELVTAETLARWQPNPVDVRFVMDWAAAAGFEVGPFVGLAFPIAGPLHRFEELFDVALSVDEQGVVGFGDSTAATQAAELPLDGLDPVVARLISGVVFEARAELDPEDTSPTIGLDDVASFGGEHPEEE